MLRIIHYIRVSTRDQARNGESLDTQRRRLEADTIARGDTAVAVLVDEGRSAKNLCRPQLQEALRMLRDGEADCLKVVKLDRLTRSIRDFVMLTDEYFAKPDGPQLVSLSEMIDTSTANGRMLVNLLVVLAQWEREMTGERVRDQIEERRASRLRYCASIYGRRHVPFHAGPDRMDVRIEVDPEQQATIDTMIDLRSRGFSYRQIADRLNRRSIAPPRGRQWYPMTVKRILDATQQAA